MDSAEALLLVSIAPTVPLIGDRRDAYKHLAYCLVRACVVVFISHLAFAYFRLPLEMAVMEARVAKARGGVASVAHQYDSSFSATSPFCG